MHHPTAAAKPTKKFHIFHERHVWKPSPSDERRPSTENAMIAAAHLE